MMVFLKPPNFPASVRMLGRSLSTVSESPSSVQSPNLNTSSSSQSESMSLDGVTLEKRIEGKVIVRLDRPQSLNSLSTQAISLLSTSLEKWFLGVKMLLITSRGKVFCAGGDLKDIAALDEIGRLSFFRAGYKAFHLLPSLPVPSVCLVRGPALGAGVALTAHCRFAAASDRATFCLPEAAIGFYVDNGASNYCSKLFSKFGHFMAFSGSTITAQDAKRVGLVSHVVAPERFHTLERELLEIDDPTDEKVRSLLDEHEAASQEKKELTLTDETLARIEECFSEGSVEEVVKRLKKDGTPMAKRCLGAMRTFSPTSLKVIKRCMDLGATRPLAQSLKHEVLISSRITNEYDFKEGVRATLIDKDRDPVWNPATLEGVSNEYLDRILALPEDDDHDLSSLFILPGTSTS